jgi:hypothetical protein
VRRFNHLQARLLLQVQDELREFEAQLQAFYSLYVPKSIEDFPETSIALLIGLAVPKQSVRKGQITVRWFYDGTRLLRFPFSVIVSNKLCTIQMWLSYRLPTMFLPF